MPVPVPPRACNNVKPPGTPVSPQDAKDVKLFQPFQQQSVTMHNRIGVSPMCMYSSVDGNFNNFHVSHYGSFALKGAGLIIIEATGVVPEGRKYSFFFCVYINANHNTQVSLLNALVFGMTSKWKA